MSGFLTLKLGGSMGGRGWEAFVGVQSLEKTLKTKKKKKMRVCLSFNRWHLYLWIDGPHVQRNSPDCQFVRADMVCNRRGESGGRAGLADSHGRSTATGSLAPCVVAA